MFSCAEFLRQEREKGKGNEKHQLNVSTVGNESPKG